MSKKKVDLNSRRWAWDPNDHLPVYVHRSYFVNAPESPTGQIEYSLVSYPNIVPNNANAMEYLDKKWMVATDLVPIRTHCEFLL